MRDDKDNLIIDLTFKFSLSILDFCEILESIRKYVLARQLLKSGTSIGANVREAQNAESKADFVHKFKMLQRKQMRLSIGYYFVKSQHITQIQKNY